MGSGYRWEVKTCLYLFFAVSMGHVATGGPTRCARNSNHDKIGPGHYMSPALNLCQATASYINGFFVISTIATHYSFEHFCISNYGISRQQINHVIDCSYIYGWNYPDFTASIEVLGQKYPSCDMKTTAAYLTMEREANNDRREFPMIEVPRNELMSGRAIWSLARDGGMHNPHKQRYEGERPNVIGIVAVYEPKIVLDGPREWLDSTFNYNNEKQIDNVRFLNIISESAYYEIQYLPSSTGDYGTAKVVGFKLTECPGETMIYLVLPSDSDDIVAVQEQINFVELNRMLHDSEVDWVNLTLPEHVQIDSVYDLAEPLKRVGFTSIFTDNPGDRRFNHIRIGAALHQAKIKLKWELPKKTKELPRGIDVTKTFNANRAFLIYCIGKRIRSPASLIYVARYGWKPNVTDAETGIIV